LHYLKFPDIVYKKYIKQPPAKQVDFQVRLKNLHVMIFVCIETNLRLYISKKESFKNPKKVFSWL